MGFQVIIDVLGSVIIGSILLMILLNMKEASTGNTYKYAGNQILQSNLIALSEILDNDFKQMGYLYDVGYSAVPVLTATQNRIRFLSDKDNNGTADIVEFNLGADDNSTPNPNDKILTRTVLGQTTVLNFGITRFDLEYFDIDGNSLGIAPSDLNLVRAVAVEIEMQSTFTYKYNTRENQYNQSKDETAKWRRVFYRDKNRVRI